MKITAAVVPARSAPFEVHTLDLAGPRADEVLVRIVASGMMPVLQGGRTVRGVVQGDSRPREFVPRLVDLFMAGEMPLDRLITRYDFAEIKPGGCRRHLRRDDQTGVNAAKLEKLYTS
jgi:Zn-dependent alcohol dehydrogenase